DRRRDRPFDAGAASRRASACVVPNPAGTFASAGRWFDPCAMHGERGLRKELDGELLPDIAMSLVNAPLQPETPTAPVAAGGDAPPSAVRGEIAVALPMRHAGVRQAILRYEIHGPASAPAVLVAGGISAHRHVSASDSFAEPGWANALV